jgi:hypothetical protein
MGKQMDLIYAKTPVPEPGTIALVTLMAAG